jgi:hypothetical protein
VKSQKINSSYLQPGWVFTHFSKLSLIVSFLIPTLIIGVLLSGLYFSWDKISSISTSREVAMQSTQDKEKALVVFLENIDGMRDDILQLDLVDVDLFQTEASGLAMTHDVKISNMKMMPNSYAGSGKDLMPPSKVVTLEVLGYLRDVREFFVDLQVLYPTISTSFFKINVIGNRVTVNVTLFLSDYKEGN